MIFDDEMWEFLGFITMMVVLAIAFVLMLRLAIDAYQCANYEQITGKQTNYEILAGCYVETDAGWESWEEYKYRAAASQGLGELAKGRE